MGGGRRTATLLEWGGFQGGIPRPVREPSTTQPGKANPAVSAHARLEARYTSTPRRKAQNFLRLHSLPAKIRFNSLPRGKRPRNRGRAQSGDQGSGFRDGTVRSHAGATRRREFKPSHPELCLRHIHTRNLQGSGSASAHALHRVQCNVRHKGKPMEIAAKLRNPARPEVHRKRVLP